MPRYIVRTTGNERHDTFPYSVIDTEADPPNGVIVNSYTHRQVADDVADRMNGHFQPRSVYDVTEADEQMPKGY